MILEDLYTDLSGFRQYVPGIDSSVSLTELLPSAINAKKRICSILSAGVFDDIVENAESKADQFDALCMALANLVAKQQIVFDIVKNRKSDVDVYKYEMEAMERAYMDNYFNAMDTLLQLLVEENGELWQASGMNRQLGDLPIKTAASFDELYSIDCSYLFFFRMLPIQREMYEQHSGYFTRAADRTDLLFRLNRVLAKLCISTALKRFDITEFPAVIRNLFSDTTSGRSSNVEQSRILMLSNELYAGCRTELENIDIVLNNENTDVYGTTSVNTEEDKIFLMP